MSNSLGHFCRHSLTKGVGKMRVFGSVLSARIPSPQFSLVREGEMDRLNLSICAMNANCGESAASWAGMQTSRSRYIAALDADLKKEPRDLPAMLDALKQADCVCGTRAATRGKGDNWIRIVSSRFANSVRNKLSGENISDAGCTTAYSNVNASGT